MRYVKSCGAVVLHNIESKLYVLLVQQIAGHWIFPKGRVEDSESEEETAIREVKEETNVDIEILPGFKEKVNYSPFFNVTKDVIYFLGKPKNFELKKQIGEIEIVEWVKVDEALKNRITHDQNKEVLEKAINFYINNFWEYDKK
ncbi:bis(5'-nucleosyl)-tetraphosphatase [Metamycoplasma auris]|uniref:Bis(5'-nucleosyl)-tetraphosphatase [asymmetrical] n=1 Tax=Metamycoplasma auris TaxID=51363 RepID=A0A2W7HXG0_9BACT|nr:NUDIX domain-containing protein [Metamycoplasma auris]PZV99885.1 NUDIX domain-containing protein [Metamycoplasma auris]